MHRRVCIVLVTLAAACGGTTDLAGSNASSSSAGSAEFWVKSSVPAVGSTVGASFVVSALFLQPGATSCATTTIGACTINPCFTPTSSMTGSEVTNAGGVRVTTAAGSDAIEPGSDGNYASQTFAGVPWTTGGDAITVAWARFPGSTNAAGGMVVLPTPAYVTLSAASPFFGPTSTLSRTADLTFSWTSDSPPSSVERVGVYLVSGGTQVGCNFATSAGSGVVPAAALKTLPAGAGTFNVHSKRTTVEHLAAEDGTTWVFGFNVDALARTSEGVASGTVTFQ
jgi:hypothetical protein